MLIPTELKTQLFHSVLYSLNDRRVNYYLISLTLQRYSTKIVAILFKILNIYFLLLGFNDFYLVGGGKYSFPWLERWDSNPRSVDPKSTGVAKLSYAPICSNKLDSNQHQPLPSGHFAK